MTTKNTADLRLILNTRTEHYGGKCIIARISICYLSPENDNNLRHPLYSAYGDDKALNALDSLVIGAQNDPERDTSHGWYGWDVEYRDVHNVDLEHAQSMVKVLSGIQRKLAKLDERFGRAQDFAAYAGRVADALGADPRCFGRKVEANRDFNGSGYQWGDVDSLRYWLADVVKKESS